MATPVSITPRRARAPPFSSGPDRSLDQIDPKLVNLFREMDRIPQSTERERSEYFETPDVETNERLDEIDTPTMVVVGEYDLPEIHEASRYLADKLSKHPVRTIANSAHLPSLERPKHFNRVLTDFLKSI